MTESTRSPGAIVAEIAAATKRAKEQLADRFRAQPNDFFTEGDLAAFLVHRLYVEFEKVGMTRALIHLEYATPFRCDMSNGGFCAKSEEDRTAKGERFSRGHFDVTVFNPAFVEECGTDFRLLKGQHWDVLRPVIEKRDHMYEPVALAVFELMYLRDPFEGEGTMTSVARAVKQDWEKLRHALEPTARGFSFATSGAMLLFDNGLSRAAAQKLQGLIPQEVELYSTALLHAA